MASKDSEVMKGVQNMPCFYEGIRMGEGVSGPDNVGASTTALYSCIGVAFANRTTRQGGLYHYPANTLSDRVVWETLRQMTHAIQPTEIVVTPATNFMPGGGSTDADVAAITGTLTSLSPGVTVTVAPPAVSAQLLWTNGAPQFNRRPHEIESSADDWEGSDAPHRIRTTQAPSTVPRPDQLGGGQVYYGVDMEAEPTLNQPEGAAIIGAPNRPQRRGRLRRVAINIRDRCRQM